MKKKDYQTPTMQIVQLKQQAYLLQASGQVDATRSGYGDAEVETWE